MSVTAANMKRVRVVIIILSIFAMFSSLVRAEEAARIKTVEVIGTSVVHGDDIPAAKDESIANSLVSAVARIAADLLPLDALVRNFQTLNDTLYTRTGEFVRDYKVLTSLKSGNEYRVIVQATVFVDKIEQQLLSAGIMVDMKEMPRVLFFISEQRLDDIVPTFWPGEDSNFPESFSEIAMSGAVSAKGFTVIDPVGIFQDTGMTLEPYKTEPEDGTAVSLGLQLQADLVIIGKSISYRTQSVMGENIRSFKSVVTVRALRTDTGEEIAAATQTAITTGTDEISGSREALKMAGALAGEDLASRITGAWQKRAEQSDLLEIMVEGTGNLASFVKFRRLISGIPGVKEIQIKEMKSNEATLLIDFEGSGKDLADALMLKNLESIGINIYEVSQSRLKIELKPG
ncbi:MAG: hypothetical protein ABII68_02685 [Pseudomonadota bacterium]